ncbi:hypothetical protein [Pedobacter sp. UC225_65]|uniref:hypothetical protein n=1 Tax=Pedobacter sp. UC225_65 TaxID=3350173 RepID=UPI0036706B18
MQTRLILPDFNPKIKNAVTFDSGTKIQYKQETDGLHLWVKKEPEMIDKID